jgi:hypothetical protein
MTRPVKPRTCPAPSEPPYRVLRSPAVLSASPGARAWLTRLLVHGEWVTLHTDTKKERPERQEGAL